jgi:hypothetical protein
VPESVDRGKVNLKQSKLSTVKLFNESCALMLCGILCVKLLKDRGGVFVLGKLGNVTIKGL